MMAPYPVRLFAAARATSAAHTSHPDRPGYHLQALSILAADPEVYRNSVPRNMRDADSMSCCAPQQHPRMLAILVKNHPWVLDGSRMRCIFVTTDLVIIQIKYF
jgi:hypothetical protein